MRLAWAAAVAFGTCASCKFPELPLVGEDGSSNDGPVACNSNGADPTCPPDSPVCVAGTCIGRCFSDEDCEGRPLTERVCLSTNGACVACDEDDVQAEPGSAEDECPMIGSAVCDGASHACRACVGHAECHALVCSDGTCADEDDIVYVATTGVDGMSCGTRSSPCLTLQAAVDRAAALTGTTFVFMEPDAMPYAARSGGGSAEIRADQVHIIGHGAQLRRTLDGPVVEVLDGATVTIEGLTVRDARGQPGYGIRCSASTVVVSEAIIENNEQVGLYGSQCHTKITRTIVRNNEAGGIVSSDGTFDIVNNFVYGNGRFPNLLYPGISVSSGTGPNSLEFNTVVLNQSQDGAVDGIDCINFGLVARNNIIVGLSTKLHVTGNCTHRYTLLSPDGALPGEGNMVVSDIGNFMFMNPSDYHIRPGSIAQGRAQSSDLLGESLFDFDGHMRAAGGATVDVGADEIP